MLGILYADNVEQAVISQFIISSLKHTGVLIPLKIVFFYVATAIKGSMKAKVIRQVVSLKARRKGRKRNSW